MPRFYRGPWVWKERPFPQWEPPTGFVGLDLRSIPEQSRPGGSPGIGIFYGHGNLGSDYDLLGVGSFRDIKPGQRVRDAIPCRRGRTLQGDTLLDLLRDTMTSGADPTGDEFAKPLVPGHDGILRFNLGDQSHSEPFTWGAGHTPILQDLLRSDFAAIMADAEAGRLKDRVHHRRWLDDLCCKYKVADWREFVPQRLQANVPGRVPRETTITDNFTRADGTTIGNLLTWTETSGDMETVSNQVRNVNDGIPGSESRAETDLSSSDHYSQASVAGLGSGSDITIAGVLARHSASAATFYNSYFRRDDGKQHVRKCVTGTYTELGDTAVTYSIPEACKLECSGTAIKGYQAGVQRVSVTDSAISGNTRCGIHLFSATGSTKALIDDFEAADLAAAVELPKDSLIHSQAWHMASFY